MNLIEMTDEVLKDFLKSKYTEIFPLMSDDYPYGVRLKVNQQSFNITSVGCENLQHAEWFQNQLSLALLNMIKEISANGGLDEKN